jgi:hypothetical protein
MKNKNLLLGSFLATSLLLGSGCASTKALVSGALLTPSVTQASTNPVTGELTPATTNFAPNPTLVSGIETARQLSPLAPAPFGWIIDGVGGLALAGLGLYAKRKSGQFNTAQAIAGAVVAGVEAAGHAETKAAIAKESSKAGVAAALDTLVQNIKK